MAENIISDRMKYNIRTTPEKHEIRLTIENVSNLPCETKVIGPDFYLVPECICSITFEKDVMTLSLYIRNTSDIEVEIERRIVLFDCKSQELYKESGAIPTLCKNKDVDMIGVVGNRTIYDELTNDMLIIDLCVTIKKIKTEKRKNRFLCAGDPGRKLREDFKTMLEAPNFANVSILVGEERITAHWSVLCSRSQHFKKMYDTEYSKSNPNFISITDLSLCTFKNLLEFLYTADFVEKGDLQELFDLHKAANKYEVMDLRTLCACRIMNNATPENVCDILEIAESHKDNELEMEAMDFLRLQLEAVLKTEGWKKFRESKPQLAKYLECKPN